MKSLDSQLPGSVQREGKIYLGKVHNRIYYAARTQLPKFPKVPALPSGVSPLICRAWLDTSIGQFLWAPFLPNIENGWKSSLLTTHPIDLRVDFEINTVYVVCLENQTIVTPKNSGWGCVESGELVALSLPVQIEPGGRPFEDKYQKAKRRDKERHLSRHRTKHQRRKDRKHERQRRKKGR